MEALVADLGSILDPTPVLQIPHGAEGEDQFEAVEPKEASQSNLAKDPTADDHSDKPLEPQPE